MIELTILENLKKKLSVPVALEERGVQSGSFVIFEKTSGSKENHLESSVFAFQSYGPSMYEAAKLNDEVKQAVEGMIELDEFASIKLNSDYNFTDTSTKRYRYQAVFDMKHY